MPTQELQDVKLAWAKLVSTRDMINSNLAWHGAEQVKTLEMEDGCVELQAVMGPDYGGIYDHELVSAVQCIAGNGTGDMRWKVPGILA